MIDVESNHPEVASEVEVVTMQAPYGSGSEVSTRGIVTKILDLTDVTGGKTVIGAAMV